MLNAMRAARGRKEMVQRVHAGLVARAREPVFFRELGVPDTIDGRFDVLALHAWLAMDCLKSAGLSELAQALANVIFVSFDEGMRDLGAGDMGMGRHINKLGNAFYGRLTAYETSPDEDAMTAALLRNLYRGEAAHTAHARTIARYALAARRGLAKWDDGVVDFGPLPVVGS